MAILTGTIPAQVDTSIFRNITPVKPPDVLDQAIKLQQLRLQKLKIQQQQMEIENNRRAMQREPAAYRSSTIVPPRVPPIWEIVKQPYFYQWGLQKLSSDELNSLNIWFTSYVSNYSYEFRQASPAVAVVNSPMTTEKESFWEISEDGSVLKTLWDKKYRRTGGDSLSGWITPFDAVVVHQGSGISVLIIKGTDVVEASLIN